MVALNEIKNGKIKIGLITGKKAYPIVKEIADQLSKKVQAEVEVIQLDIGIAAFQTTQSILKRILEDPQILGRIKELNFLLLPGLIRGSTEEISEKTGVPTYKATSNAADLEIAIKALLEGKKLSYELPAEEYLKLDKKEAIKSAVFNIAREPIAFKIGKLPVPLRGPPMLVASETPVSVKPEEVASYAERYEMSGADIVVVGIPMNEDKSESIKRIDRVAESVRNAILGIDTNRPDLMYEAYELGAEIFFSLNPKNLEELRKIKDKAFVLVPLSPQDSQLPPETTLERLRDLSEKARKEGFEKLFLDPILSPPGYGLGDSLHIYYRISKELKDFPFMMGFSNVVELFDADSIGINALLTQIAAELGASLLLTSEESWKARGSTAEVKIASIMSSYSVKMKTPPHNIGIELLIAKSKFEPVAPAIPENIDIEHLLAEPQVQLDKGVYATVHVDHKKELIYLCFFGSNKKCYSSKSAKALYKRAFRDGWEISKEHAAYIGYELAKAEIALLLGKPYVQDAQLLEKLENKYRDFLNISPRCEYDEQP